MTLKDEAPSAADVAFQRLHTAIQTGQLSPNQRLVERDLETMLGLSRTPIREALRELEKVGLIEIEPNRGAVVRDAKAKEIAEVYEVRLCLERLAFDLMRPLSPTEMKELKQIHRRLGGAVKERQFGEMVELNDRFHDTIVRVADSEFLTRQLAHFRQRTYLIRHRSWENDTRLRGFISEHAELINLLESEDWPSYIRSIIEHIMIPVRLYFENSLRVTPQDREQLLPRLEALARAYSSAPRIRERADKSPGREAAQAGKRKVVDGSPK